MLVKSKLNYVKFHELRLFGLKQPEHYEQQSRNVVVIMALSARTEEQKYHEKDMLYSGFFTCRPIFPSLKIRQQNAFQNGFADSQECFSLTCQRGSQWMQSCAHSDIAVLTFDNNPWCISAVLSYKSNLSRQFLFLFSVVCLFVFCSFNKWREGKGGRNFFCVF